MGRKTPPLRRIRKLVRASGEFFHKGGCQVKNWLWPVILLVTALLSLFAVIPHIAGVAGFQSDFAGRPVPTLEGATSSSVQAVYLVVVDGLRFDVTQTEAMPFLAKLRRSSAWGKMRVGLPSYLRPGYERILSGASAELTGLTMNDQTASSPVPTIFSLARTAGRRTAASTHYWALELADESLRGIESGLHAGQIIQRAYAYVGEDETDSRVFANAKEFIRADRPDLTLILPASMDRVGHASGGGSAAYRRAAKALDATLEDFYYSLPDQDFLLIITADHGHRNAGGHGGEEREALEVPLLLAGPSVSAGKIEGTLDQLDLAPTIAAALGLPMAGSMGGRVLEEAFRDRAFWRSEQTILAKAQAAYVHANLDLLGGKAEAGRADFSAIWQASRKHTLLIRFLWRLPLALLFAAAVIAVSFASLRRLQWRWPMLAGLTYPLYFYAVLRLLGVDYSYSAILSAADFAFKAVLAALISLAILTWAGAALRRGREPFFQPVSLGLWTVQCLLTVTAWAVVGYGLHRFLPDLGWQVFLMVQLVLTTIVSLYAAVGWMVGRIARRPAVGSRHEQGVS